VQEEILLLMMAQQIQEMVVILVELMEDLRVKQVVQEL
jgi:hypothetical protein